MSEELPKGWVSLGLEKIVTSQKGKTPAVLRSSPANGFVPYLDIHAIETNEIRRFAEAKSSKLAAKDALFVVWDGARSGWIGSGIAGAVGSTIVALMTLATESTYLRHFITSQFQTINLNVRGTGIPHVDPKVFWNLEVPLAPLAEQRRIVAKLEKLLGTVDACQKRLEKIPVILKRFRQSVLAAACSGRLTADWREGNHDTKPYPVKGVEVSNGSEYYDELPVGWQVAPLGQLTALVTSGSRGWAKYYADSGSTFIRAQNINSDWLDMDNVAFVKLPNGAEGLRTRVNQHDLLITITGANVTKTAIVERPLDDAYVSQHLALVRLTDVRLSRFLFYVIISVAYGRKQLEAAAYGQGKPGLNLDNIRRVLVPLPPLPEQQEIVRRVGELFALADRLEARYKRARAHTDKLTQSILAKAFRGELVPQDPNDEPASELLKRIVGQRKSIECERKAKKRHNETKHRATSKR